ncbi:rhodanese-like domain-containing protein [Dendrosporobacter sp. 1207_IL3150]|uniref:rhodanese-like domain-containing protein n=1 Tax=Dendrosporobacter sp. 1207_IL3150 TaxID=3084054 RepID=UPI002FD9EA34
MHKLLRNISVLLFLFILTFTTGCDNVSTTAVMKDVSTQEALEVWRSKQADFIDVRTNDEYTQGHIPGAKLIPLDELAGRITEIPKDTKIMLICRSGNRSTTAAKVLLSNGYTNIYNVSGGMLAWKGPTE